MTRELTDQDLLNLTKEQAVALVEQGKETAVWALLQLSALARNAPAESKPPIASSTPSSQIPPYAKPAAKKGRKKRGRPAGHAGACRRPPLSIDRREAHTLGECPDCGAPLAAPVSQRKRIVEDIERTRPVTTEHTIHAHWCPRCKKRVEPRVTDALPKSTIGNRALVAGSWFHYGLGQTTSQVAQVFDSIFHFPVSEGGLAQQWMRLAQILAPWYERIADQARASAVLNIDETGWRVNGKTHWLWCFAAPDLTYYHIDATRAGDVVDEFLADCFEGTLVSDFFAAYNIFTGERQLCLAHLLRELKDVSEKNASAEWIEFAKTLKRILKDAIRLSRRDERERIEKPDPDALPGDEHDAPADAPPISAYARRVNRIHLRLDELIWRREWTDADAKRLVKRLDKYRHSLFTFLDNPDVPFDNNRAEREIRPAVIARKNSFQNTSQRGAETQAILMSVYRTLKLRGHDPVQTLADALALWIARGALPDLPSKPAAPAKPVLLEEAHLPDEAPQSENPDG